MIEYYLIAALSFAIMYAYSYGCEISNTVLDLLYMFDMDYRDYPEAKWSPKAYILSSFVVSFLGAPFFLYIVLFQNKYVTVKAASGHILQDSFGLKKEDEK